VPTRFKWLAACLLLSLAAFAQSQMAIVTSDSPFQLRGATVNPGQGVPSWPVMPGDTIQAGGTPLFLTFPDGSMIVLAAGASAKVYLTGQTAGQTPTFDLQHGSAHYTLKSQTSVKLLEGGKNVAATSLIGDLQIGNAKPTSGWWTTGHTTAVIAGAGGLTALGVGLKKPPPVSPTNCNNGGGNGNGLPPCK